MVAFKKWSGIVLTFTIIAVSATKPAGYVKPPAPIDKDPPNYKYSYDIANNEDGTSQGKLETRDGEFAHGQYYVSLPEKGASSQVRYFADDWGYHPLVQYSTTNAHSKVSAQFALGEHAVKALKDGQQIGSGVHVPQNSAQQYTVIPAPIAQPLVQQYVLQPQSSAPLLLPVVYAQQFQPTFQRQDPQSNYVYNIEQPQQNGKQPPVYIQDFGSNQVASDDDGYGRNHSQTSPSPVSAALVDSVTAAPKKGVQNVFIIHDEKSGESQNDLDRSKDADINYINIPEYERQQNREAEYQATLQNGGYGTKLVAQQVTHDSANTNSAGYRKLVQNTQNLVTGADVLNINGAIEYSTDISNQLAKVTPQQFDNSAYVDNVQNTYDNTKTAAGLMEPIVVAEFGSKEYSSVTESYNVVSSTESYYKSKVSNSDYFSTTQNTIETEVSSEHNINPTEPSLTVTPRPVSNSFLAPITAALRIQNSGERIENLITADCDNGYKHKGESTSIEIQKSIPYYIGKFEYFDSQGDLEKISEQSEQGAHSFSTVNVKSTNDEKVPARIEYQKVDHRNNLQEQKIEAIADQQTDVSQHHIHPVQQVPVTVQVEKVIEKEVPVPAPYPVEVTKIIEKPIEVTKYVDKPYPVHIQVPVEVRVPYEVEKQVQVPVEVEKIIEKPVHITKYIDRPYPVPQPYPVEVQKVVEKQVPVEVTRYVDKPYPVQVKVPHPYPVEKIVEKTKYIDKPYPVAVPVQVPIEVTKYIDKPYPVEKIIEKKIHVPVHVEKIIEKPVTQIVEKPYRVNVEIPVPHPVPIPVEVPQPYPVEVTKYVNKPYPQPYPVPVPHPVAVPITKLVSVPVAVPKYIDRIVDRPVHVKQYIDRPYPIYVQFNKHDKHHHTGAGAGVALGGSGVSDGGSYILGKAHTNVFSYAPNYPQPRYVSSYYKQPVAQHSAVVQSYTELVHNNCEQYYGPAPPRSPFFVYAVPKARRNANPKPLNRHNFGKNLRIEYGFKPPMVPSVETDEHGTPLKKEDH